VDFFTRRDKVAARKLPAVLFLNSSNEPLDKLQEKIYFAVDKLHMTKLEPNKFTQHITFARVKYDISLLKDKEKLNKKLDEVNVILKQIKFDFSKLKPVKIVLYKSELCQEGPITLNCLA